MAFGRSVEKYMVFEDKAGDKREDTNFAHK